MPLFGSSMPNSFSQGLQILQTPLPGNPLPSGESTSFAPPDALRGKFTFPMGLMVPQSEEQWWSLYNSLPDQYLIGPRVQQGQGQPLPMDPVKISQTLYNGPQFAQQVQPPLLAAVSSASGRQATNPFNQYANTLYGPQRNATAPAYSRQSGYPQDILYR